MRVLSIQNEPLLQLRYLNAARGGGSEVRRLRVELAHVEGLPAGLEALVATADLQGVVPDPISRASTLLGVAVVDALEGLAAEGSIPSLADTGAVLAGDLYSVPAADRRGGFGDVRPVWAAFASSFRWVAGVAGNHDDVSRVRGISGAHLLDVDCVELDGLRLAGVGLIAGNPAKPGRRSEEDQLARIERVCEERPDLLLLHEGPSGGSNQGGNERISAQLAKRPPGLVVCGHEPWSAVLSERPPTCMNVCERVLVLTEDCPRQESHFTRTSKVSRNEAALVAGSRNGLRGCEIAVPPKRRTSSYEIPAEASFGSSAGQR